MGIGQKKGVTFKKVTPKYFINYSIIISYVLFQRKRSISFFLLLFFLQELFYRLRKPYARENHVCSFSFFLTADMFFFVRASLKPFLFNLNYSEFSVKLGANIQRVFSLTSDMKKNIFINPYVTKRSF